MIRKLTVTLLIGVICFLGVTSVLAVEYNEAPMLKTKVATGELPSVEQRLPEVPYTIEKIGQYGGTLRCVRPSPDRDSDISLSNMQPILQSPVELIAPGKYKGNIIESCEVSEDYTVFTFHLRKGMKWSDGYPLTSEDFLFTCEDVLLNEKLTPVLDKRLMAGGEPMKLEAIDDYTVRITFAESYGGFPYTLGCWIWPYQSMLRSKHYLKQFHPRYTPMEELEPLIKEEGLEKGEWWTLFGRKSLWETVGQPTLEPWVVVEKKTGEVNYERNPYFFKVDGMGNQLPYIDKLRSTIVTDPKMAVMKAVAGEVDFMREITNLDDVPLFKENEAKSGYRVVLFRKDVSPVVLLNLSNPDPVWRKVVRDLRFRKALNMAINREELIDAVYIELAGATEVVPHIYDPEEANRLLDEMGLDKRDKNGWRLGPDGKKFIIPFEIASLMGFEPPATELIAEDWKAVGIYTTIRVIEFALWAELGASNEIKASIHWAGDFHKYPVAGDGGLPNQYSSWGPAFRQWYDTDGKAGEEPTGEIKRLFELRDIVQSTTSEEERTNAIDEVARLVYDNIFFMMVGDPAHPIIYHADLGNVPPIGVLSNIPLMMAQYLFYKQ